jgi:transcriptional regulator with XRE-family HTH domain
MVLMECHVNIGDQLHAARVTARLTVAEVAARAGVTASHISQIERGIANPSIGALNRICDALGIRMSALFLSSSDEVSPPDQTGLVAVVRRGARNTIIPPGSPVRHELMCPDLQHQMEAFISFLPPHSDLGDTPLTHSGEEWSVVIKGVLEISVGGTTHILDEGDAIYFDASIPHSWKNATDEEVQVIWAATPPHF